jgi:hypothetical protein
VEHYRLHGGEPVSCYKPGAERECPSCHEKRIRERSAKVCCACSRNRAVSPHGEHGQDSEHGRESPAEVIPAKPPVTWDEKYAAFNSWIGRTDCCVEPPAFEGEEHTIIHLADCHVPYCNLDALRDIVASTRGASCCVVGGDFFDAQAFSRFVPTDATYVGAREEISQAQIVLQFLAENYPRVIVRRGNHPDRVRKYFATRIPPEMMFLVTTDLLPMIANGLPNVEIAQPVCAGAPNSAWITMRGDCAFTHGETHSVIEGRPVTNVDKWMRMWEDHLPSDVKVICQEHNHAALKMPSRDGKRLLIMTPALSTNVNYQFDASLKWKPNHIGYTRIVQNERGETDWNLSGYYLWRPNGENASHA